MRRVLPERSCPSGVLCACRCACPACHRECCADRYGQECTGRGGCRRPDRLDPLSVPVGSVPRAAYGVVVGTGLAERAGPGIEERADRAAVAACELADAAAGSGRSSAAADDALVAIDTLTAALAEIDPEVRDALIAVTAATTAVRRLPGPARRRRAGAGRGRDGVRGA